MADKVTGRVDPAVLRTFGVQLANLNLERAKRGLPAIELRELTRRCLRTFNRNASEVDKAEEITRILNTWDEPEKIGN